MLKELLILRFCFFGVNFAFLKPAYKQFGMKYFCRNNEHLVMFKKYMLLIPVQRISIYCHETDVDVHYPYYPLSWLILESPTIMIIYCPRL